MTGVAYVRMYLGCRPIKLVNDPPLDLGDYRDAGRYDSPQYPLCCETRLNLRSDGETRHVFWLRTPSAAELSTYYYP